MTSQNHSIVPQARFEEILRGMPEDNQASYGLLKHLRIEHVAPSSTLVMYRMKGDEETEASLFSVGDLEIDSGAGVSVRLHHGSLSQRINYTPTPLWDNPDVFVWLPLNMTLKYVPREAGRPHGGLRIPLAIRTLSRRGLREPGVTYLERSSTYQREFNSISVK